MKKQSKMLLSKLMIGFIIIVSVLVLSIGGALAWATNSIVQHSYMEKAALTANALVKNLNIEKIEQLAKEPVDSPLYRELQAELTTIWTTNPITYLYIVIPPNGQKEGTTLLDAGDLRSEDTYHIGEPMDDVYYEEIVEQLAVQPHYSEYDNTEEFGELISSYVPLKNKQGEIFAILGVDDSLVSIGNIQQSTLRDTLPLFIVIIISVSTVLMAGVAFYLYRLLKPIGYMREAAFALQKGELQEAIEAIEEADLRSETSITMFGRAFHEAIVSMKEMIEKLYVVSADVTKATTVMGKTAHSMQHATTQVSETIAIVDTNVAQQSTLATSMTETMELMAVDVKAVNLDVQSVEQQMKDMTVSIHNHARYATEASAQVLQMRNVVQQTAQDVEQLTARFYAFESMVDMIQNVADQTNLLALNASIEAARAGEHGKGFAVVADEVRNLAEMTKQSTAQIRTQITEFKAITEQVVGQMDASTAQVTSSAEQVNHISEGLATISAQTDTIVLKMHDTDVLTTNMLQTTQHVTKSIAASTAMTTNVVQTMTNAQQTAVMQEQTVEQLQQATVQLQQTVQLFEQTLKNYKI